MGHGGFFVAGQDEGLRNMDASMKDGDLCGTL